MYPQQTIFPLLTELRQPHVADRMLTIQIHSTCSRRKSRSPLAGPTGMRLPLASSRPFLRAHGTNYKGSITRRCAISPCTHAGNLPNPR
jgi:hypothetical protein